MKHTFKWLPVAYVGSMALIMLGYVRYDPYQIDGDAVSYMDIASSILHGRWHEAVNGLWNPGYPALLALGKFLTHADRMHELAVFYWVNYFIFLISIACGAFFVQSVLLLRTDANIEHPAESAWMLPSSMLYLAAFAIVFLSWQHEFSLGKIRVDGLFASLLLLAFGCLLRMVASKGVGPAIGMGLFFGLAYLVKSPGLIIAFITFFLFAIYLFGESRLKQKGWGLLIAMAAFATIAGPYLAALSVQKGRFDAGDSGRLNYAWYVSGTEPLHLLNNQPARFGHADVHLKHSQIEMMSNPGVVSFAHFPNATYGPWFDPSYFNEGVAPRFSLRLQLRLAMEQSRRLWSFVESHSLVLALLIFSIAWGARIVKSGSLRRVLFLLYFVLSFCFLMYLCVHFLDRYVAGMFWFASIATLGLLILQNGSMRGMAQGATMFMGIAILLLGAQSVAQMRQATIFSGSGRGWNNTEEFETARKLHEAGIVLGSTVACFRACNTGSYWARLAGVHITSEIFDPRYVTDMGDGEKMWQALPNKAAVIAALRTTGAQAIVGYFELPPAPTTDWKPLAGHYYLKPLEK